VARGRDTVICLSGACERHDELLEDDGSGYLSALQRAVTGVAPPGGSESCLRSLDCSGNVCYNGVQMPRRLCFMLPLD
jgi:hypothetical protein